MTQLLSITAVSRNPGQLDLFFTGLDGHVYTSSWTAGHDWPAPPWRNIGGIFPPGAPVSAVSRSSRQLDLFVCGNDGRVYTSWWSEGADWSGLGDNWRNIGGVFPAGAPVAAVSRNPNQLDLFICGNDSRVYTSWWSDGTDWSGLGDNWRNIGGVFPAGAPVAAVSRSPNQLDLFICGNDGRVYTSWWSVGADWSGLGDKWRNIGGVFPVGAPVAAVSRNPNQLDLFICGNDGRVYTSWWSGIADWSGLGDSWRNIGGVFPAGARMAAVSRNPNQLDLFICGNDSRVYTSGWSEGLDWSGLGDKWRNIGGVFPAGTPVAAVNRGPDQFDLFIGGNYVHVYTSWWTAGGDWSGLGDKWRDLGGMPLPAAPQSIGPLQTGPIFANDSVPVGGSAQLTLWSDGSYVFQGEFHDSGFPSFNDGLVFVVKSNLTNTAYTFGHAGHMAGTVESGSRDDNWNLQSRSVDLEKAWSDFGLGWSWNWQANTNSDFNSIVDKALAVVGLVTGVVGIVKPAK